MFKSAEETIAAWIQEADNGSDEHQAKLGAHFLSLADAGVDREENEAKAIQWLLRASRQGNTAATADLQKCIKTGTGITTENMADIQWCLNTSASEKKIRHAARTLFHRINKTHKDVISRDEYMEAINGLTDSMRQQKLLAAAGKKIGEEINENEFVKMLSQKIQGQLTLTSDEMDEMSVSYQSASIVNKIFVYPRQTANLVFDRGLEWASKEGLQFVMSMVPTNQIYILAMLFAYSFITPTFILFIIPLFSFYLSTTTLIVATLQMFYKKKKQKDATDLAHVLHKFDVNISIDDTESQYSWNSLTPYFVFFSALPVVVISFALSNKAYIPCSEFCFLGAAMAGFCFIGLSDEHDKLTFMLLFAQTIASLPIFLERFPDIPLVARVIHLMTDPFLDADFGIGVKFNLSIPSVFYMIIPLFFLRMGMKKSWNGLHLIVIPHLVCYFWWNVMTTTFPFTTWLGLGRATMGCLLLPLLLPLSLVVAIGFGVYICYHLCRTQLFGKIVVTLFLLAIPLLLTQTKVLFGQKVDKKMGGTKKVVMVIFAILAVVPLVFIQIPQLSESKTLTLSWEDYEHLCVPAPGDNVPVYQIRCASFVGTRVTWVGKFKSSKITKIDNTAESVLKALPSFISKPLYCIYGDRMPDCDAATMPKKTFHYCNLMQSTGYTCDVKKHNIYSFQVDVSIGSFSISLDAGNGFHTKVMALAPEDELEFTGSLIEGLGTTNPRLKLNSIQVLNRELPEMMGVEREEDENYYYKVLHDGARVTLNFFFFPVFEYTGLW